MNPWLVFLLQPVVYGLVLWIVFAAVSYAAPRRLGLSGFFVAHVVVAAIVMVSDLNWILTETRAPDWSGTPDLDILFHVGLFSRILLVNTLLLPVCVAGWWVYRRKVASASTVAA